MHIVGPVNSLSLQGTELQHGRVEAVGGMFQQKIPRDGFYLASDFGGGGEILNGQTWVRHPPLSTPLPPEIRDRICYRQKGRRKISGQP